MTELKTDGAPAKGTNVPVARWVPREAHADEDSRRPDEPVTAECGYLVGRLTLPMEQNLFHCAKRNGFDQNLYWPLDGKPNPYPGPGEPTTTHPRLKTITAISNDVDPRIPEADQQGARRGSAERITMQLRLVDADGIHRSEAWPTDFALLPDHRHQHNVRVPDPRPGFVYLADTEPDFETWARMIVDGHFNPGEDSSRSMSDQVADAAIHMEYVLRTYKLGRAEAREANVRTVILEALGSLSEPAGNMDIAIRNGEIARISNATAAAAS